MQGIAASPGIVIGKVVVKRESVSEIKVKKTDNVENEIQRFQNAIIIAKEQLNELKNKTEREIGKEEAEIFEAHLFLVDDPELKKNVEEIIKNEKLIAENAVDMAIQQYAAVFAMMEDEYMRARGTDLKDIQKRIINILSGKENTFNIKEELIVAAEDLTPSDTAQLDTSKVRAFVMEKGSRTSHSAIMARSIGIPAVVSVPGLLENIKDGDILIVDGNNGKVYVNPTEVKLEEYRKMVEENKKERKKLEIFSNKKAKMADGIQVAVYGNIGNENDLEKVIKNGAEGVGLFRTEFLYMNRDEIPSEEEQFRVYKIVAEKMGDKEVIIRTLDIGGDKELPYLKLEKEMNPFLGYRAIRICLDRTDIFKTQLRAILRASVYGNLKIMFPMISSVDEIRKAKKILGEVKEELKREKISYKENIETGIMIEIPSAAVIADILAEEVDFFSIGTNDLIQYTIAVDRMNEKISNMYNPYHPAVLKLIENVIKSGHGAGINVGMCGEAAADELLIPFLLGCGLDEFSMGAVSILKGKEIISKWNKREAEELKEKVLKLKSSNEILDFLKNSIK